MEIKLNKDIRKYKEEIYWGLTIRQIIVSAAAIVSSVVVYFSVRAHLPIGVIGWICIMVAIPFALLGFVKYKGMPFEQFAKAWFRAQLLAEKKLFYHGENKYQINAEPDLKKRRKEEKRYKEKRKRNDQKQNSVLESFRKRIGNKKRK